MAPPSTPDRFPTSEMFGETVEVKVGEGDTLKTFTLHKGVLSFYSRYFQSAIYGAFREAWQGCIELPTEESEVFNYFVHWLYTRQFHEPPATSDAFRLIIKVWAFADRRDVPLLANTMINAMRDRVVMDWAVPTSQLHDIYENTTAQSGLRRLVVRIISASGDPELIKGEDTQLLWPKEALLDVLRGTWQLRDNGTRMPMNIAGLERIHLCQYHCHEVGV